MRSDDFDVAVVGGGLVGAAMAWGLARVGQRVVVLDEGDAAVRASRGNFALVWVQTKGLGLSAYSRWTLESSNRWQTLADELREQTQVDVCFERPGGFHLCLSDDEFERRANTLRRFHEQPGVADYPTEMLDRRALAAILPEIGSAVVGASFCPVDGHVNSLRLFRALYTGMDRMGVDYRSNQPVRAITPQAGGFRVDIGVPSVGGGVTLGARRVVLAAGNANARLAPMIGLQVPMKPERGQIIVTERVRPFLRYPLSTIRQTDEGTVMIGDSKEEGITPQGINRPINTVMAQRAVQAFPMLGSLNVVRTWRAIRVMPADGFPIYEESLTHPGGFVTTCHSGVTLAAAHALVLAPMIANGRLDPAQVDAFSTRRFDVQASQ